MAETPNREEGEAEASSQAESDEARAEKSAETSAEKKPGGDGTDAAEDDAQKRSQSEASSKKLGGGARWWIVLLVVLVVEMWIYGRDGELHVCVGKEGSHDFSLVGQERTDDNRWKFPRCEERLNLGLRSQYDEQVEQAVLEACRGATMFKHRGEGKACLEGKSGWEHRVETHYVWPWDSRFYEHLFWFLQ